MAKFKYLRVTTNDMMWGKQELSKEYFVNAVQSGDAIIDLEDMTYFDKDSNEWKLIDGDKREQENG
jgi:hypothetical protein